MNNDIINYRKHHKNCKYCIHAKFESPLLKYGINCPDYYVCECSDNIIRLFIKALWCRYYKVC